MLICGFGPAVANWDSLSTKGASRLVPIKPAVESAQIATIEIKIRINTTGAR
jgi:hypothetical protein